MKQLNQAEADTAIREFCMATGLMPSDPGYHTVCNIAYRRTAGSPDTVKASALTTERGNIIPAPSTIDVRTRAVEMATALLGLELSFSPGKTDVVDLAIRLETFLTTGKNSR